MYLPEMFGSDGHCLRPDGAGGGDHDQEEAAHTQHLEGGMEGRPGPEPAQSLHPLHDDWQGEHARGRHGDPRYDHLRNRLSVEAADHLIITYFRDSIIGTRLGVAGGLPRLVSESHALPQLLLPHQGNVDAVSGRHGSEGNKSLNEPRGGLGEGGLQPDGRPQGRERG